MDYTKAAINFLLLATVTIVPAPLELVRAQDATAGTPAPNFRLQDIKGGAVELSQLNGKIVLLDFWASWCAPCVAQLPDLIKLQEQLKEKGLVIVGVSLDNADEANHNAEQKLKAFVAAHGINYPVVEITPDFNLDYGKVLGLKDGKIVGSDKLVAAGLPSWIIIDRAGIIRGIYKASEQEQRVVSEVTALTR